LARPGPGADAYWAWARALLLSWLRDVPHPGPRPLTLICSSEAFPGQGWIEDQIPPMVGYLAARWQGTWNHGLEQDLQILGIGCAYPAGAFGGQALTWRQVARRQMLPSFAPSRLGPAVDGQGVTNEQAVGYANLTYGRVRTRRSCRPSSIRSLIVARPPGRARSANWTP
jgi:hypothetical protein